VLVYVGAVMVLFLFVVMMLDINTDSVRQGFWKHFPLAGRRRADRAGDGAVLMGGFRIADEPKGARCRGAGGRQAVEQYSNTKELGKLLYTSTCTRWRLRPSSCWWP
jgi:NADH-quinone oxidoreductase subunit J